MACLLLSSCATVPKYRTPDLPAYALTYFSECRRQDGAATFFFSDQGSTLDKIDVEWVSKANADWSLASYSPLGQTIFQANYTHSPPSIQVTGRQNPWFGNLSVDREGFLRWKGEKLGLKATEVACLFAMKIPRAWLKLLVDQKAVERSTRLEMIDETRQISILLSPHGANQDIVWEFVLQWQLYWGIRQESLKFRLLRSSGLELSSESYPELGWRMSARED